MFVPWRALNSRHPTTEICRKGEDHKLHWLEAEEARAGSETSLTAYGQTLTAVSSIKYMGRVLSALDDDFPAVISNLRKLQKKWACLLRFMGWEVMDAQTLVTFYRKVVQAFLLFGLYMWVMPPRVRRNLGGFHCWVVRQLTGRQPRR